ncbi:unnamed protein product [Cyprideis torosa]|uniref:Uncharacterized protein n=1 Tax=Cyprideis torosa TaxID=163714 RepID=A0A7R8WH50_9CRUS|nr:unnamed protein product [Cyprideis torosa]CAG0892879.1 unnamed protein product [Cyprideis torosa]
MPLDSSSAKFVVEADEAPLKTDYSMKQQVKERLKKSCTKKNLLRKFPVVNYLRNYTVGTGVEDAIAGFTVGLTVIPQAIAYADVAGLPVQYGLYSAFMGCFVYFIFGSVKDITIGPTAIMAIMVHEYVNKAGGPDHAVLLCFIAGIIELILGFLNMGFLVTFISTPVTSAFVTAAAITIACSQLKSLFGVKVEGEGIVSTFSEIGRQIGDINGYDFLLGSVTIVALLILRWAGRAKLENRMTSLSEAKRKLVGKIIWFICTARNALLVLIGMAVAVIVQEEDSTKKPLHLTGDVKSGLPPFALPPFSVHGNETAGEPNEDFGDMLSSLGQAIFIIPLIAILEHIAIAKAFAKGKPVDANQEMIALGLCNVLSSFVSSFPVTGSFSRTAVNATSGVRTPAGGLITGALVILALGLLTPYFYYIPKATLGAVIICAVIFMVEYEEFIHIWKTKMQPSLQDRHPDKETKPSFDNAATPDKETKPSFDNAATPDKENGSQLRDGMWAGPSRAGPGHPDKETKPSFDNAATPDKETKPSFDNAATPDKELSEANKEMSAAELVSEGEKTISGLRDYDFRRNLLYLQWVPLFSCIFRAEIDLIPWCVTFFACLFYKLEYGILIGAAVSIVFVVYAASHPKIEISDKKINGTTHLVVCPRGYLFFPSVDTLRQMVLKAMMQQPHIKNIVVDCSGIRDADFTTAKGLDTLVQDVKRDQDIHMSFYNPIPKVERMLRGAMGDQHYNTFVHSEATIMNNNTSNGMV